nr:MAG TPA: hypothetical protein [Caudoviricetes sp.]
MALVAVHAPDQGGQRCCPQQPVQARLHKPGPQWL